MLDNPKHEQFAQHVARGLNAKRAYIMAGYSENGAAQSARRLLQNAQVRLRVDELKEQISRKLIDVSIKEKSNRLQAMQERWDKLRTVIARRAADPDNQTAYGGETGLFCRTYKSVAEEKVTEFAVDTGLLKAMLDIEMAAAKELGQIAEKLEHSGPGISIDDPRLLKEASREELELLRNLLRKIRNEEA